MHLLINTAVLSNCFPKLKRINTSDAFRVPTLEASLASSQNNGRLWVGGVRSWRKVVSVSITNLLVLCRVDITDDVQQ